MRNRLIPTGPAALIATAAAALLTVSSNAQQTADPRVGAQLGRPAGETRRPSGPPAPTPRLADGTPNLGREPGEKGVWNVRYVFDFGDRVVGHEMAEGATRAAHNPDFQPRPWVPYQPWSRALYLYNVKNESKYDPEGYCLPPGGPRMMVTPYPMEIVQLPEQKRIIMMFEGAAHIWREIYMDGRPHPTGDALNPTYLGHSVGHWEGDTLVVDVVGFNEASWLDPIGNPHTDLLHVIEKYSRPDKNTLHYEATIDDPGAYTKPWTVSWDIAWRPNAELSEYICQENNRYFLRLTDDFGQPLFGR